MTLATAMFHQFKRCLFAFVSLPSFSLRALLDQANNDGRPIRSLVAAEQFGFYQQGLLGGITSVGNYRFGSTNLKNWPGYDENRPQGAHLTLNAVSLYGSSMLLSQGERNFITMTPREIRLLEKDIANGTYVNWSDDAYKTEIEATSGRSVNWGFACLADLQVSNRIQNLLVEFPCLFVKRPPSTSWMSPAQKRLKRHLDGETKASQRKRPRLGTNQREKEEEEEEEEEEDEDCDSDRTVDALFLPQSGRDVAESRVLPLVSNVTNYNLDFRTLKFFLQLGISLVRIKFCIRYHMYPSMRNYIAKNIELRKRASTQVESQRIKNQVSRARVRVSPCVCVCVCACV